MESIDAIPPELSTRLVGVVFDVDDTVTRHGRLERAAFDAMWDLARAGFRLLAVTGRPLGWCDVLAQHWPVDGAVGENGAGWVWRRGRAMREGYFHSDHERRAQRALLRHVRERVEQEMPDVPLARDARARRCDLAFDIGEETELARPRIEALRELVAQQGARTTASSVHVHVIPGDWDKGSGIARALADIASVDVETEADRWAFVGDSVNDAEAFALFSTTIGVCNIRDHVDRLPTPPRYVTEHDRGEGFAELAHHLLT